MSPNLHRLQPEVEAARPGIHRIPPEIQALDQWLRHIQPGMHHFHPRREALHPRLQRINPGIPRTFPESALIPSLKAGIGVRWMSISQRRIFRRAMELVLEYSI
jgi:hypothetical protein